MKIELENVYHAAEQDSWKPWWNKVNNGYNSQSPSDLVESTLRDIVEEGKLEKNKDVNIKITIEISEVKK